MANQYKNLSNFKAYKARIFEYLSAEIIKLPEFFKYQSLLTGQASSTQTMAQGGIAQQTIRNGQVVKNRNIAETILSFDNAASQHKEDDDIITRIAVALQNNEPNNINLNVGLYIWPGYGELAGPYFSTNKELYISEAKQLVEGMIGQIAYLPFIRILNSTDILLSPDSIQPMYDTLAVSNTSEENFPTYSVFKSLIETKGFDLTEGYNIADNTSQFLPVGAKKRNISKKILRDTSETAINELLPTTSEYKIDQFFKSWQKIQSIVPLGKEYIVGGTYINNGDFSGGVGPGILTHIWDTIPNEDLLTLLENEESNVVNYPDIGSDSGQQQIWDAYNNFMDTTFASFPNSPWRFGNRAIAAASQQIEEFENPGFSPFVLSSRRNAPTRFFVKAENLAYTPGLDYTLSAYVTQDDEFNQLLEPGLKPENIFFYRIVAYEPNAPDQVAEIIKDYPAKDINSINILENGTEFRTGIKGENVSNWFGETSEWTRYKHTFNYNGYNSSGELIDMSQYQNGLRVRIEWNLAYQNSVMNVFDASNLGITEFATFFTGPRLNQNNNQSKQYYTGIRINVGDVITGLNRIELSTPEPKTITSLLKNCIDLTLNESGEIPLYSSGQLNALIRAQDSSTRIFSLLNEIRNGLITTISDLSKQFGEVIPALVQSFTQDAPQNPPVETDAAREASEAINQALSGSNLPNAITTLTNNFDQIYTQIRTNDAALLEGTPDPVSHTPSIQQLNGYDDDGFQFSEPLTARYNEYHEKWVEYTNGEFLHEEDADDTKAHLKAEFSHQWVLGDSQYLVSNVGMQFDSNINLGSYPEDQEQGGLHELYSTYRSFLQSDNQSWNQGSNSPILPNIFEPINNQTPIAAMYHSEMTPYNENINLRGGIYGNVSADGYNTNYDNASSNDSYFNNYFDYNDCYPGYTYGPYAAKNSPRTDFGYNPIQRMIGIMDAYISKMDQSDVTGIDAIQQFQGMGEGDNGVINNNFTPLKEYVYITGRGREWMYMVYPKKAHSTNTTFTKFDLEPIINTLGAGNGADLLNYIESLDQGFGMTNLHNQGGGQSLQSMQEQGTNQFPLGYNKNTTGAGASGDYYHGILDYSGANQGLQGGSPANYLQYHRFYEPHWEWNPIMNKFIFRFAQPVIGSTAHRGLPTTHQGHPLNGYGGQHGTGNLNNPPSYMGERKYKFASMKIFNQGI